MRKTLALLIIITVVIINIILIMALSPNKNKPTQIEQRSYIETVESNLVLCYRIMPTSISRYNSVSRITDWNCKDKATK